MKKRHSLFLYNPFNMAKRMLPRIASQRLVFRAAMVLVSFYVTGFYVIYIVQSDLRAFMFNTAGPIFAALATLCGLTFSFADSLKNEADKSTSSLSGEKLLHATLLFAFSVLVGFIAIQVDEFKLIPILGLIVKGIAGFLGLYLLYTAFQSALYGIEWLSDILYMRWSRRAEIEDVDPKKLIKDRLEHEVEGLPEQFIKDEQTLTNEKELIENDSQKLADIN